MSTAPSTDPDADLAESITRLEQVVGVEVAELICQAFLLDVPRSVGALELALAAGDTGDCVLAAHTIKGSSASFGLAHLTEVAAGIEQACRAGHRPPPTDLGELHHELARVRAVILARHLPGTE